METNANDTAYPAGAMSNFEETNPVGGLTKLEYFSAMALGGFCSNTDMSNFTAEQISRCSLQYAEALIKALNEKEST